MKRRYRLLIALSLLLMVVASLLHPAVHWRVIGWARGEAFYQGRPTSYWSAEVTSYHITGISAHGPADGAHVSYDWIREASWAEQYLDKFARTERQRSELMKKDGQAVPVLIELLHHPSPQVRLFAADWFQHLGSEAKPAVKDLLLRCNDPDARVRYMARQALRQIDAKAAATAGSSGVPFP